MFSFAPVYSLPFEDLSKYTGPKIVGGREATASEFPYNVVLRILNPEGDMSLCGGGIISKRWVITAAHCFYPGGTRTQVSSVCFGVTNIVSDEWHSISPEVEYLYPSEPYNQYDIALIRLTKDIKFGPNIQKMHLPSAEEEKKFIGKTDAVSLAGFGSTFNTSTPSSNILRAVNITIFDSSKCASYSAGAEKYRFHAERHICAGSLDGKKDACVGDSGGPLVAYIDHKPVILGIVSFGDECAKPGVPGLYTKVSHYLSWIHQTIPKHEL